MHPPAFVPQLPITKTNETLPAIIFYLTKSSHICSSQRKSLYRPLHTVSNRLHWTGTKRNLQHHCQKGDKKSVCVWDAEGQHNSPVQSSTALDRCTQQGKHTALITRHIWAGGAAKPCVSLLRQSITHSKLTAQNRRQYLILTFPKQFLLAQVIHTQELSNSN